MGSHFSSHPETSEVMNPYSLLAFGPIQYTSAKKRGGGTPVFEKRNHLPNLHGWSYNLISPAKMAENTWVSLFHCFFFKWPKKIV